LSSDTTGSFFVTFATLIQEGKLRVAKTRDYIFFSTPK